MKIYVLPNGVTLVGKVWEVRAKLKEYAKKFDTVQEWMEAVDHQKTFLK